MAALSGANALLPGGGAAYSPPSSLAIGKTMADSQFKSSHSASQSPSGAGDVKAPVPTPILGFNPSSSIDPETHIVVLKVKGENGDVIRQIPSEQQIDAYKAQLKKS